MKLICYILLILLIPAIPVGAQNIIRWSGTSQQSVNPD